MQKLNNLLIDPYLISALKEDITYDDISSSPLVDEKIATVELIAKEDGVLAGIDVFKRVFELLDEDVKFDIYKKDGQSIKDKEIVAVIEAKAQTLLSGERVALNYLQRMSGVASNTKKMIDLLKPSSVKLLDTRKTTPNMRIFEKYAVKVGGGGNHRYNLSDAIMLKDNHITLAGGIKKALKKVRQSASFVYKIEVEVESIKMVKEAIDAKVDIIMLDNMSINEIKKCVKIIDKRALIECSGNINAKNIKLYRDLGVDFISSGSLTYGVKALDFSMKNLHFIG